MHTAHYTNAPYDTSLLIHVPFLNIHTPLPLPKRTSALLRPACPHKGYEEEAESTPLPLPKRTSALLRPACPHTGYEEVAESGTVLMLQVPPASTQIEDTHSVCE